MAGRSPSLWRPGRLFIMGGTAVAVPAATRTLIASRILEPQNSGQLYIIEIGLGSQQFQGQVLWEIINGGQTIFARNLHSHFGTDYNALPLLRTDLPGRIDIYGTHSFAGATSLTVQLEGFYGSR